MQSITSYSLEDRIRVIIQGPPKAGKSVLAMQFPKPYFIDLDVNLGGPLRYASRAGLSLPVGYDVLDKDEKGNEVKPQQRYARLNTLLKAAQENPEIETIVIDSATQLTQVLIDEVCRSQGKLSPDDFKDGRQFWGFFGRLGVGVMAALKSMRKHIVLTAHEKVNKTADGSIVYPIKIAWPGQLGQVIGAYFTDVWRCETVAKPVGMEKEYKFVVRTMPDNMYELGNGLGLPPVFEFKWDIIAAALTKTNK